MSTPAVTAAAKPHRMAGNELRCQAVVRGERPGARHTRDQQSHLDVDRARQRGCRVEAIEPNCDSRITWPIAGLVGKS